MGVRIPVDASQNVQNAFRDVEQAIEELKASRAPAPDLGVGAAVNDLLARIEQLERRPPLTNERDVFTSAGPQHSPGLVPDPGSFAAASEVLGSTGWITSVPAKLAQADQTPNGPHDVYNVPVALHVAGPMQSGQVTTDQLNAWSHPGLYEAHGGVLVNPNGITATINVIAWRAPYACRVVKVQGYRVGGTSASINARNNGASNHLSSALSLTSADSWMDGGAVQNVGYAENDKLEIMLTAVGGSPTQIGIQVWFQRT